MGGTPDDSQTGLVAPPSDPSLIEGDLPRPDWTNGSDDGSTDTQDSGSWSFLWFIIGIALIAVLVLIVRRACTKPKPLPRMRVQARRNASGKDVNPYPEGYTPPASVGHYNWSKQGESDRQLEVGYHDTRGGWEDSRAEGENWERSTTSVGKPGKVSSMSMIRQMPSSCLNG